MVGVLLILVCCLIVGLTILLEAVFYAEEQQS
jgi:hypothetical protein